MWKRGINNRQNISKRPDVFDYEILPLLDPLHMNKSDELFTSFLLMNKASPDPVTACDGHTRSNLSA